ncbi:hypothetical protein Tco_1228206 [Tanacetum coccineum]
MTHITVKKLKEPLEEHEREMHRLRRVASRQQGNESLKAQKQLSYLTTSIKQKTLRKPYLAMTWGSHKADECDSNEPRVQAPENRLKPTAAKPQKLEQKELSEHLEYAFLQGDDQLPVIISSTLPAHENTKLLKVLKIHNGAIAWSIVDIKGIDSSYCTHKILMEDEFKPTIQPQRRVNPNIKEVVNKEVIKLLDAGLIHPISNNPWVSPVQVVPKKGWMTVVKNEKNELIPQRTVTR